MVVGGKLPIGRALGKIGITGHPMGRGKRALLWSSLGRWSPDERGAVQKLMEGVYESFVARVAEGRKKSPDDVRAVAQGRVWTGRGCCPSAVLADCIGGLEDALAAAREIADIDEKAPLEVYPPPPTLLDLLGDLGAGGSPLPVRLDAAAAEASANLAPREAAAVVDLYRQLGGFATASVQTALLLPIGLPLDPDPLCATTSPARRSRPASRGTTSRTRSASSAAWW